jgi:cytosine/adenosine deaminase-related metal-dependent hydrolase
MALITATQIHDGDKFLPEDSIIELDDKGTIIAIHDASRKQDATFYEGILCPGFVNVHCHLELSHMKGLVPEHTGLIPFLKHIPTYRDKFTEEQKKAARHEAYTESYNNGIVAIGDIANTTDTLDIRAEDKMHIHTFIESIGFTEERAEMMMGFSTQTYSAFAAQETKEKMLRQSIVPHAPYSVSSSLFKLINAHTPQSLISIHNQESEAEHHFYLKKDGAVNELLAMLNINTDFFQPSGKSSLQTYVQYFEKEHSFIFVHNTYTGLEDAAIGASAFAQAYWCLCPNANLYIENRLPDIPMLMNDQRNICIGTDSLASNHQLSILAELQTINKYYPEIGWETLLRWGTSNGAKALRIGDVVGNIKTGLQPGIVQIDTNGSSKRIA